MKGYHLTSLLVLIFWTSANFAQISEDCRNAVPICTNTPINGGTSSFGIDDFNNADRSGCLERSPSGAIETNAAWYRFKTGVAGQLGFNIGFDSSEDWDFALYKTNDCNTLGEPVRCNFFGNSEDVNFIGVGEDPSGNIDNPQYEDWLQVEAREDYYLLINNFSSGNSGFSIQFSGTIFNTNPDTALDCSIISNLLGAPIIACENEPVILDATTNAATTYNWFSNVGAGFEIILGENGPTYNPVISAVYRVEVNTVPGNTIISDVQVAFSASPDTFMASDETICSDSGTYDLSQKNAEAIGSQDPGMYMVKYYRSLLDALDDTNALPQQYPIASGVETIYYIVFSIENKQCFDAPQEFELSVIETPFLGFLTEVFVCDDAMVSTVIGENFPNPSFNYSWDTGETTPTIAVNTAGTYTLTATNTLNGETCSDTQVVTVVISKTPEIASIETNDLLGNVTTVTITTTEVGAFEYQLDDGDFQIENKFTDVIAGSHRITVNDLRGCGAVTESIVVVGFKKFFTPNGDDANDLWQIEGISELEEPIVVIFDRYGKLLTQLTRDSQGWDGTFEGILMPSTDYWFKLSYVDIEGTRRSAKYLQSHFSLKR